MKKIEVYPEVLCLLAKHKKCFMCKKKFEKPYLLKFDLYKSNKIKPNADILFHLFDTHGLDPDTVIDWLIGAICNLPLDEYGVKGGL